MPEQLVVKSLLPILRGVADPHTHREQVRCEYYRALNPDGPGSEDGSFGVHFGSMLRRGRHKLCVYHGHPHGELFDLEADPHEFNNLWDAPEYVGVKLELMQASFDALVHSIDLGPAQVVPF